MSRIPPTARAAEKEYSKNRQRKHSKFYEKLENSMRTHKRFIGIHFSQNNAVLIYVRGIFL